MELRRTTATSLSRGIATSPPGTKHKKKRNFALEKCPDTTVLGTSFRGKTFSSVAVDLGCVSKLWEAHEDNIKRSQVHDNLELKPSLKAAKWLHVQGCLPKSTSLMAIDSHIWLKRSDSPPKSIVVALEPLIFGQY